MIEGLACAWPTESTGSREGALRMSGEHVGLTAKGSRPHLPGLSMGCRDDASDGYVA